MICLENLKKAHILFHDTLSEDEDIDESADYMRFEELKFEDLFSRLEKRRSFLLKEHCESGPLCSKISQVQPNDSVSHSGKSKNSSTSSSVSSAMAKLSVIKAGLLAKAASLQKLKELEQQQLQLKQRKRELEIETGLAETEAEEIALANVEGSNVVSSKVVSLLPEKDPIPPNSLVKSWLSNHGEEYDSRREWIYKSSEV